MHWLLFLNIQIRRMCYLHKWTSNRSRNKSPWLKFVAPSVLNIQSNKTFEDHHDDGVCWNSLKILVFFIELMANYERRRSTIMTNIGGHQFRHLTNWNITMSILYQSTIGDFLWSMQECKSWFCITFFFKLVVGCTM